MVNMSGRYRHKKWWHYPEIEFARLPVPHYSGVSVSVFISLLDLYHDDDTVNIAVEMDETCNSSSNNHHSYLRNIQTAEVKLFIQGELNNFVSDLALSKEAAEILGSHLREYRVLDPEAKITFYRNRDRGLVHYLREEDFVFCNNVQGLSTIQLSDVYLLTALNEV